VKDGGVESTIMAGLHLGTRAGDLGRALFCASKVFHTLKLHVLRCIAYAGLSELYIPVLEY